MKNNKCPSCGSSEIYISTDGGIGDGYQVNVQVFQHGAQAMTPTRKWETHLCAECGYFENHLLDRDLIGQIVNDPQTNGWKKAS